MSHTINATDFRPFDIVPPRQYDVRGRKLIDLVRLANRLLDAERLSRTERETIGEELIEWVLGVRNADDLRRQSEGRT